MSILDMISKLIFFATMLSFHASALACSCGFHEVDEAYNAFDYIFKGKVTSVQQVGSSWFNEVTFEVYNSYKGAEENGEKVFTHQSMATCGFPLHLDKEYIVFAFRGNKRYKEKILEGPSFTLEGKPIVTLCSPTLPLNSGAPYFEKRVQEITNFLENVKKSS